MKNGQERVIIESISPRVNGGEFPARRIIGDRLSVEADIFCDSHDVLGAEVKYRWSDGNDWKTAGMTPGVNDRWKGTITLDQVGTFSFTITAWVDHFHSWYRDILKKMEAGTDNRVDLQVGAEIMARVLVSGQKLDTDDETYLRKLVQALAEGKGNVEEAKEALADGSVKTVMDRYPLKEFITEFPGTLNVIVERERAGFSAWYEVFPRSLNPEPGKHGTFRDCINFLPYVAEMGFDVLYLPPVHPIGETHRKGKNNNRTCEPGDPGSPWAIGNKEGGHTAIHPELGTMDDFRELVKAAEKQGLEVALDMAFQCSPDHPWVKEHPEWFRERPDGSLQYAENPPKKYEDIYPLNFESDAWKSLWEALKQVFLFWIDKGVKIFRVDNPHTKSLRFWGWVIGEIHRDHPGVIFLAEAFTRPKVMYQLAKQGFTQSYTYFTWRNTKYELTTYCRELVETEVSEYFRPNFWPNTPDILPEFLQVTNRAGFLQRLILASTLSSNYGIYGPAFELMENTPLEPGKEEYLDSEKYEIRTWDIHREGNLQRVISRINRIRKDNPALHNTRTLRFHEIDNEALLCYSKHSDDLSNIILVVVNLDPHYTHSGWIRVPLETFGMDPSDPYQVHDLLGGAYFLWYGEHNYVEINPGVMPAHVFRIRRKVRTEQDFDYFM